MLNTWQYSHDLDFIIDNFLNIICSVLIPNVHVFLEKDYILPLGMNMQLLLI